MENSPIRFSIVQGVARLVLANPGNRNAVDRAFVAALTKATLACVRDETIRVITITAEGPAFCVGADLSALHKDPAGPAGFIQFLADEFHASLLRLRAASAPVVVAVQGVAAGGGFGVVCSADIAIAARSAMLTSAYTASGLTPDVGATWFTPRLVGRQRAFDLLATNPHLSAEDALTGGLITRIAEDGELETALQRIVETLLEQPVGTAARLKKLLAASPTSSLAEQLDREAASIAVSVMDAEVLARLSRFAK